MVHGSLCADNVILGMDPDDISFTDPKHVYLIGLSKASRTQKQVDSASTWHSMTKFNIGVTPKSGQASPMTRPQSLRLATNPDLKSFGLICEEL